jgi:hypothetical protein
MWTGLVWLRIGKLSSGLTAAGLRVMLSSTEFVVIMLWSVSAASCAMLLSIHSLTLLAVRTLNPDENAKRPWPCSTNGKGTGDGSGRSMLARSMNWRGTLRPE